MEHKLVPAISKLLNKEDHSDVKFHVGVGTKKKVFYGHKLIFRLHNVSERIFDGPIQNGKTNAHLKDVAPEDFEYVIRFIYTEEITFDSIEQAKRILKFSKKYSIQDLQQLCQEYISDNISTGNFWKAFSLGIAMNDHELILKSIEVLESSDISYFLDSKEVSSLSKNALLRLINFGFSMKHWVSLFRAMLRWAEKSLENGVFQTTEFGFERFTTNLMVVPRLKRFALHVLCECEYIRNLSMYKHKSKTCYSKINSENSLLCERFSELMMLMKEAENYEDVASDDETEHRRKSSVGCECFSPDSDIEKELGNAAYKKGDFKVAMDHYRKALQLDPLNILASINIAAVYMEMQDYQGCINQCKKALRIEKGLKNCEHCNFFERVYTRMADAYMKLENYKLAKKNYEFALKYNDSKEIRKKLAETTEKIPK